MLTTSMIPNAQEKKNKMKYRLNKQVNNYGQGNLPPEFYL